MGFNPFSALTSKIFGGLSLALVAALAFVMWRADTISGQRDDAIRDFLGEQVRHEVTRQSVATLESTVAEMNRQAEKRAEEYRQNRAAAARETARLQERARTTDAQIARLRALANDPQDEPCAASPELLRELEGL